MISSRFAWGALAVSALALIGAALYFQHAMHLDPCVLCVYQRTAVLGLLIAGLVGLIAPAWRWLRGLAYGLWGVSAGWGLTLAAKQAGIQLGLTKAALDCSFEADYPSWAKLDQWLPWVFTPTGSCGEIQWQFLGLSMPQWMVGVFVTYLIVLAMVLLAEIHLYLAARRTARP